MRQLLDSVWQRRGASWVWDEQARNQICAANEEWSVCQFLRAAANWPQRLPSNDDQTLVVADLDANLDPLIAERDCRGQRWPENDVQPAR